MHMLHIIANKYDNIWLWRLKNTYSYSLFFDNKKLQKSGIQTTVVGNNSKIFPKYFNKDSSVSGVREEQQRRSGRVI